MGVTMNFARLNMIHLNGRTACGGILTKIKCGENLRWILDLADFIKFI